ncbi:lactate/malate family dehydrogenase [Gudongella sp. SC589]|uniref:lactate/malate family dehydrogenase n=1 Tax=Gudongella sp. SC589 TaxID=3385990 RepID=UPI0039046982
MYYYRYKDKLLFSKIHIEELDKTTEDHLAKTKDPIYYLKVMDPFSSRRGFLVKSPAQIEENKEGLDILKRDVNNFDVPDWIEDKIRDEKIKAINISFPRWKEELDDLPSHWRINVIALGDVGSTLLIGLRLLGSNMTIGIYDRTPEKVKRWEHELGQIRRPYHEKSFPAVEAVDEEDLFNCDMVVFCASRGIPPVGSENIDVRMVQFEGNREILMKHARAAREKEFKGIFAVVSDPVDLLCRGLYLDSNTDVNGNLDYRGLAPNQIIGYGLGVMNARACFHAEKNPLLEHYFKEGQVFGPHGKGLIVADSMINYNEENSLFLTEKTLNSNLEIRGFGFKPFVAPSLSSGALSLIATIENEYFYGSSMMGEVFMGAKMRLTKNGLDIPSYSLHPMLENRLEKTYNQLRSMI